MSRYGKEVETERFRGIVERTSIQGASEFRVIDGTTKVGRSQLLSARDRIIATASNASSSVVGGIAASVLHGSPWFDRDFDIELLHPVSGSSKHGEGRVTHRYLVDDSDYMRMDGVLVTTPVRTAFDVGRITPEWRGLGYLDALRRATGYSQAELVRYIDRHKGWRHLRQLRAIAPLVDGRAESPPESWVRFLIITGGLPSPDLQIEVRDEYGHVFARIDLGYEALKIGIEYDGEEFHSTPEQQARDAARDAKLGSLGWTIKRIDSKQLRDEPWLILAEIHEMIRDRRTY